jgi:ribose transport system substrate-binding protein
MDQKRLLALIVVGAALSLVAFGCSHTGTSSSTTTFGAPTPPSGATQIAFVTNNVSDYWLIAEGGVTDAAKKLGRSVNVQFVMPADGSAATQKEDVQDLIAKGVKAIAISPADPKNQTLWINQISSQIPVITQDSDAPLSQRLAYLGTDNHSAGLLAGKEILKALPHGGKIMLFVGNKDEQNAHDREMGIRDALKGSNIQILDVRTDNVDHALAKTNAADAITANPDLAMEVGLWSYNGPAIVSAIEDAHEVGKVKVICFDQEKGTLAGVKSGAIFATIVQQPYQFGYQGTLLLAALAKGDKSGLPAGGTKYFPAQVVDSTNIDSYIIGLDKETGESWGPSQ